MTMRRSAQFIAASVSNGELSDDAEEFSVSRGRRVAEDCIRQQSMAVEYRI